MPTMPRLVLTLVGDDQAGLVNAVADVVTGHEGNWETSQLAELAGAFAGIVVVSVPAHRVPELTQALRGLRGLLTIATHPASDGPTRQPSDRLTVNVLGNDHPGIVRDVTAVLRRHGLSIESMTTETRDAPMSGGRLFEAAVAAAASGSVDLVALRDALEGLAAEILVDITIERSEPEPG